MDAWVGSELKFMAKNYYVAARPQVGLALDSLGISWGLAGDVLEKRVA